MSNIRSLKDLKEEEDKKQRPVNYYTGGHRSGLAVENSDDEADAQALGQVLGFSFSQLTVYRNGFIVDHGKFVPLDEEEHRRFMRDLNAGRVPKELSDRGVNMKIALKDRTSEVYKDPSCGACSFGGYKGEGKRLGGDRPSGETPPHEPAVPVPTELKKIDLDESKPTTVLQFRLLNGRRLVQRFHLDHTVAQVHEFVESVSPFPFRLIYDFPRKTLEKSERTVEEAQLQNMTITQERL